jgi:hypothetical protein
MEVRAHLLLTWFQLPVGNGYLGVMCSLNGIS